MPTTSERMLRAVDEYPDSFRGLNRISIKYRGRTYGSPWEVILAKKMYAAGVKHREPRQRFEYFWCGAYRKYLPDFYLPEYDIYVEVKGYVTPRDIQKWKSCGGKLVILTGSAINRLTKNARVKINAKIRNNEVIVNETPVKISRISTKIVNEINKKYKLRLTKEQRRKAISDGIRNSEYFIQKRKEYAEIAAARYEALHPSYKGKRNSQYGSFWITDGEVNKKWREEFGKIPRGYKRGRIM